MPGIAGVVAPNYPHHIARRGTNKTYIFLDDEDRRYFLQSLKDYADRTGTKIWDSISGITFCELLEYR